MARSSPEPPVPMECSATDGYGPDSITPSFSSQLLITYEAGAKLLVTDSNWHNKLWKIKII